MSVNPLYVLGLFCLISACTSQDTKDTVPPSGESLTINSGATITYDRSVTLGLAVDGADEMFVTNAADCASGGEWVPFQTSLIWKLDQPRGPGSVYAKFRDKALNESACTSASINLIALSEPRKDLEAATVGDTLLFASGSKYYLNHDGYTLESYSSRVDLYNKTTQTWSQAELSAARSGMATATIGDEVLFVGGHTISLNGPGHTHLIVSLFKNIDIYHASTNSWSTIYQDEPLSERSVAVVGRKAYFAGGGTIDDSYKRIPTNRVDIYDAATQSWSTSTLPVARAAASGFTLGDKAIFVGGIIGFQPSLAVDVYDTKLDTWTSSNLLQEGRFGAVIGDKLYYTVGDKFTPIAQFQVYDANTNSWSLVTLPSPVADCTHLVATSSKIILVGKSEITIYDPANNTLTTKALNFSLASVGAALASDTALYLVGGLETDGSTNSDQFHIIDL